VLRHKLYIGAKVVKSHVPGLRRFRLLKTSAPTDRYGDRRILDAAEGNDLLFDQVVSGEPISAGKIGDCELEALVRYVEADGDVDRFFYSITKQGHELNLLYVNCGVFPREAEAVGRWAEIYLESLGGIDLLAVWHNAGEEEIADRYAPQATLTRIRALEPYYHPHPWTASLAGRRVLVVTPFEQTISLQRAQHRGADLFPGAPDVLPDFDVSIVRAPFSAALVPPAHSEWSDALEAMKEQIRTHDFDVCLVGAGAYSLPLCAFVRKELDRTAVHLGGATQVLFGIRGRRWDGHPVIKRFFTDSWIRPLPSERPRGRWRLEGGAYW
jgi:hypothetical protein